MDSTDMEPPQDNIIEEAAPGMPEMDRTWMISFWEVFTECVIELDARYRVTNLRRKADSSFSSTNIVGESFLDIAAPKDRELVRSKLDTLKTAGARYVRFTFQSVQGNYYRWTIIPFFESGEFAGCHGMAVDSTEQTKKEITLNWQSAIIDGAGDFISIADMDGNVLYTNPGAYKMTGYDPSHGPLDPKVIFTRQHLRAINGEGAEAIAKTGYWSSRGELIHQNKMRIPIEHTMFAVEINNGESMLIGTVIRDVTVFFEHERSLDEARREAEAANLAKSEFLSRMSHEIRTPMNAVLGMINIGLGTQDVEKKDHCFARAESASKHLLGIINDVLDMSKIEADKFELSYSSFDFEKMLKNITNMANVRAEEKKQDLIVNLSYDVPAFIHSDELRLSQVITNLLTNAIKFTPERGTIILSVEKIGEDDADVMLQVGVSDTGIGISEEQQKRLFTSFNQADASIAQTYGGSGLGLAISKRIIELMGGRIWIVSEAGKGSQFIFTLQTKKVEGKTREQLVTKVNQKKMRILAVDDSDETREYLLHIMDALNLRCDVASDGYQALHMIESAKSDPYNVFFVDWMMPGMDGIELSNKIKKTSGENSVVIMISANDWNAFEEEAKAVGVDLFIPKPLFPSTISNAINICMNAEAAEKEAETAAAEAVETSGAAEPAETAKAAQAAKAADNAEAAGGAGKKAQKTANDFSDYTVLIAEDVDINREIMSAVLEDTGIAIDYAENGKDAVCMFSANPRKYNMILMDINMPEMDGYEATRLIRACSLPRADSIPIVAMTANVFREDIEKCLAAGMNDHIGKPIDVVDLFAQLTKYLCN